MKTFYLVRHAKSNWDNPTLRDIQRTLNDRGLTDAPFMAKYLRERGVRPDLLVSSPAIRALTTAAYFKLELGVDGEDVWIRDEVYEAMSSTIMQLIGRLPEAVDTVMLFGHNPTFTDVANVFSDEYIPNIPTCGIVCFRSSAANWAEVSPRNTEKVSHFFPKEL